jgi:Na+/H+ antiporter NhaC
MTSYLLFKVLHLLGVMLLFVAVGGLAGMAEAGRAADARLARMLHGIALLLLFLTGFALLSSLGMSAPGSWQLWVWIKLVVWLLLGASLAVARRERHARWVLVGLPLLGAVAAYAALVKP